MFELFGLLLRQRPVAFHDPTPFEIDQVFAVLDPSDVAWTISLIQHNELLHVTLPHGLVLHRRFIAGLTA